MQLHGCMPGLPSLLLFISPPHPHPCPRLVLEHQRHLLIGWNCHFLCFPFTEPELCTKNRFVFQRTQNGWLVDCEEMMINFLQNDSPHRHSNHIFTFFRGLRVCFFFPKNKTKKLFFNGKSCTSCMSSFKCLRTVQGLYLTGVAVCASNIEHKYTDKFTHTSGIA